MKKITLLLLFSGFVIGAEAQYDWSAPETLTDTVSYNSNPAINVYNDFTYMFYEKRVDGDSTTAIYYKDIQNNGQEQLLLSCDTVSYIRPFVYINYSVNCYYRYLFYLSDKNGSFNLYGLKLYEDGTFGNEQLIMSSEGNIDSYNVVHSYLTYQAGGDIYAVKLETQPDSILVTDTVLIDSGDWSTPVISYYPNCRIFYLKTENDESHIYYSRFDSVPFYWSSPMTLDTTADCNNIRVPRPEYWDYSLVWEKEGEIYFLENNNKDTVVKYDFPAGNGNPKFQPDAYVYYPPVKGENYMILTFTSDNNGNNNVFGYYYFMNSPVNISSNNLNNNHPEFFEGWGKDVCTFYLLDIWQTETVTGHTFLNMSKTGLYICGGIDENRSNKLSLKAYPNPFNNETTIEFYLYNTKPVTLSLMSITGKLLKTETLQNPNYGPNRIEWKTNGKLPPGVYIVELKQDKTIENIKVVKK